MILLLPLALGLAAVAVARGGGRPRPALVVAALVVAAAAAVGAGVALAGDEGAGVLAWAALPVVLVAADLAGAATGRSAAVHLGAVALLAAFVAVTGFSIGLLFLPALGLLAAAGWGTPAYVRR